MQTRFLLAYHSCLILLSVLIMSFSAPFLALGAPHLDKRWFDNDFIYPYSLARIVLSDKREMMYDAKTQLDMINEIKSPLHDSKGAVFQYPPYAFIFAAPLGLMPFHLAYRVFQVTTFLVGTTAFLFLFGRISDWNRYQLIVLIHAGLVSFPVWLGVLGGQYHWFFLALFSWFIFGIVTKREISTGVALALSSMKLQYLPLDSLILLVLGRWKSIFCAAAATLTLLAASGVLFGWHNVFDYPKAVLFSETSKQLTGIYPENHICVRGLFSRLFADKQAVLITEAFYVGSLLLSAWMWIKTRKSDAATLKWAVALSIFINLVFALHVQFQDCLYIVMTVPITLCAEQYQRMQSQSWHKALYVAWAILLFAYPFASWLQLCFDISRCGRLLILALNMTLLLVAALCWYACLTTASQAGEEPDGKAVNCPESR